MIEYLVVIEQDGDSRGAFCPDPPGMGVVGETRDEVERLVPEAVTLQLDGLRRAGDPVPTPSAAGTTLVQVPAA